MKSWDISFASWWKTMRNTKSTQFLTEDIQKLRIAVIGDVMLDRYVYGEVKRISPEAPVPVNRVRRRKASWGAPAMWRPIWRDWV